MKFTSVSYVDLSWICGKPFIIGKVLNYEQSSCRQTLGEAQRWFSFHLLPVGSQKVQNEFSSNSSRTGHLFLHQVIINEQDFKKPSNPVANSGIRNQHWLSEACGLRTYQRFPFTLIVLGSTEQEKHLHCQGTQVLPPSFRKTYKVNKQFLKIIPHRAILIMWILSLKLLI